MAIGGDMSAVNAGQAPNAPAAAIKQPGSQPQDLHKEDSNVAEDADKGNAGMLDS